MGFFDSLLGGQRTRTPLAMAVECLASKVGEARSGVSILGEPLTRARLIEWHYCQPTSLQIEANRVTGPGWIFCLCDLSPTPKVES